MDSGWESVSHGINFTVAALSSVQTPPAVPSRVVHDRELAGPGAATPSFSAFAIFIVPSALTGLKVGPQIPKLGVFLLIEGSCKSAFVSGVLSGQPSARKVWCMQ